MTSCGVGGKKKKENQAASYRRVLLFCLFETFQLSPHTGRTFLSLFNSPLLPLLLCKVILFDVHKLYIV